MQKYVIALNNDVRPIHDLVPLKYRNGELLNIINDH